MRIWKNRGENWEFFFKKIYNLQLAPKIIIYVRKMTTKTSQNLRGKNESREEIMCRLLMGMLEILRKKDKCFKE